MNFAQLRSIVISSVVTVTSTTDMVFTFSSMQNIYISYSCVIFFLCVCVCVCGCVRARVCVRFFFLYKYSQVHSSVCHTKIMIFHIMVLKTDETEHRCISFEQTTWFSLSSPFHSKVKFLLFGYWGSFQMMKGLGHAFDHSLPSSVKTENEWCCTITLPVCIHDMGWDNFFFFTHDCYAFENLDKF